MSEEPVVPLAPFRIEPAKSSRSKCKVCRRAIPKDSLRMGVLIEGPFGTGYLWHHLKCMAKRDFSKVEEAYSAQCWDEGVEPPVLDSMRGLADAADKKKKEKKTAPYIERAPSGRARCKHCGELIEKDDFRFGMLRKVEFFGQERHAVVNVHPECVMEEMDHEDSAVEISDLEPKVRAQSQGLTEAEIDEALDRVADES
jgi:poly [ADP-ribose] polymerase